MLTADEIRRRDRERKRQRRAEDPEAARAKRQAYHVRASDKIYDGHLRRTYGIGLDEYNARLEQQGHACAICRLPETTDQRMAVDHDHTTGAVRGLLCAACNHGLGKFRDMPERLEAAAAYLRSSHGTDA